jgi:PAS domain-containing protein
MASIETAADAGDPLPLELRRRAEEQLAKSPGESALDQKNLARLLHDLDVHQVALEMQNEELQRSQLELNARKAEYFDLYDMAPVGYCTLSDRGLILQANLTVVKLLSTTRDALINRRLTRFIIWED